MACCHPMSMAVKILGAVCLSCYVRVSCIDALLGTITI